jgi:hypothetical protein
MQVANVGDTSPVPTSAGSLRERIAELQRRVEAVVGIETQSLPYDCPDRLGNVWGYLT